MNLTKLPKILQPFKCLDLIRLGKNNDGGYLISKHDAFKSSKLISLGIGEDYSFERDFHFLTGINIEAYDKSVNQNAPAVTAFFKDSNILYNKNIGSEFDEVKLESILQNDNIFLKCDIEGKEYDLLETLIINSHKFSGMVIEFHSLNEKNHFDELCNFIAKTQQKLIHLHVNNYFYYKTEKGPVPDILELTFSSNASIVYDPTLAVPHQLDMPNNTNDSEFAVSFDSLRG